MKNTNAIWNHPYEINNKYKTKTAYFCMEYGIDQPLKIYSGGLGFLAGSHMRSAYELKQNLIGIGMLWKFGYYDQVFAEDRSMQPRWIQKKYHFLEETGIKVPVKIDNHNVIVKAMYLPPQVFGTAPMYLLTTNVEENDHLARTITERLYDSNLNTRIAQNMVLGIGGAKVVEQLGGADIYHMNEGHALPLVFHLYEKYGDINKVREKVVFTTHTPVKAGNEEHDFDILEEMDFFGNVPVSKVKELTHTKSDRLGYTPAALCFSKISNGVSKLHGEVANEMWKGYEGICPIISITNSQNKKYWMDKKLQEAFESGNDELLLERKRKLKTKLFRTVADQTGKIMDPDVLTIVWARRFAGYKRADLIMRDFERFLSLINDKDHPIQLIWAGKPYPKDELGLSIYRKIWDFCGTRKNCAILTGYEMSLSAQLKKGSDVWINTPRRPKEASGTSGMTAAMNGSVNFSIYDGWIPEFAKDGVNSFVLPIADVTASENDQDNFDAKNLLDILENEIISSYYTDRKKWLKVVKQSISDIFPYFDSDRMADEYYNLLYNAKMTPVSESIKENASV